MGSLGIRSAKTKEKIAKVPAVQKTKKGDISHKKPKPTSSSNGRAVTAAKANVAFDTKFQRLNPRSGSILLFSIWRANNTGNSARSAPTVAPLNKQMAEKINPSPSAKNVAPKNEIIDKSIDIFKILKTP